MSRFNIFYSDEDEGWIATCDDHPGLSGFGETKVEAKEELVSVIQDILERQLNEEA